MYQRSDDVSKFHRTRGKSHDKTSQIFKGMAVNILIQFLCVLRVYLDAFVDLVSSWYWDDKHQMLPDLDSRSKILLESATSLAAKVRKGDLNCADLVLASIERIKLVNPIINAITDERYTAALEDAKEVDKQIAAGLSEKEFQKKPFLGVPFTSKESQAVHGLLHTLGLSSRAHLRANEDAEVVRLMKAAGAIVLAVSNVPELNRWQETRNLLHGQTNNPYHTGRTVGGSSGGEGALVAAVASPIGLCSDIGGSTRMPAFYCGLFGHNPTAGVTNLKGVSLRTGEEKNCMASTGVVVKHAEDLKPLIKVVAGEKASELNLDRRVNLSDVKFYYCESSGDLRASNVSSDLRKAMQKVIENITSEVTKSSDKSPELLRLEGFRHSYRLWRYWMTQEDQDFAALLGGKAGKPSGIRELFKKVFGLSCYTLASILSLLDAQLMPQEDEEWAQSTTETLKKELLAKLGDNGVLLFPSCSQPAPYHYTAFLRPFNFGYWGIFNVLRLPATQVPLGLNERGLPLGLQVVASPNNDALCLAVSQHLEAAFGGFVPPCKLQGI